MSLDRKSYDLGYDAGGEKGWLDGWNRRRKKTPLRGEDKRIPSTIRNGPEYARGYNTAYVRGYEKGNDMSKGRRQ